jgi:poly-gamma-glutamate capsule biosynthesis protein CapA/YwtB (metallophosphatase superfamily)
MRSVISLILLFYGLQSTRAQQDTLRLIFGGDIMNNQAMIDAACIKKDKVYDYSHCFKYISTTLESADLAIGNLELTVPGNPPFTGFPKFRSPEAYLKAIKKAGFDVLVTANNHSNDSGPLGVSKTIDAVERQGFLHTGTFRNQAEKAKHHPFLLQKKGFKIALLNYTHHTNGIPTQWPVVVNRLGSPSALLKDMAAARALKPDFIIVFVHWGEELFINENAQQRKLAKLWVGAGADLVIGAHPHVVQPVRTETVRLENGTSRSGLVAYSLGNFISNMYQTEASGAILLRATIVKKRDVRGAKLTAHDYAPIWRYKATDAKGKLRYYVLPIVHVERNPKLVPGLPLSERKKMLAYAKGVKARVE